MDQGARSCPKCGTTVPEMGLFCPNCGTRAVATGRFCSDCGTELSEGTNACSNCGSVTLLATETVSTPVAVPSAQVEYMGFWIRVAAAIIDGAITALGSTLLSAVVGVPAVGTIFSLLYYVQFIGLKGQTPGKMALSIQILDAQGNVPGIWRAILREVIGKLVSTVFLLLGFFWVGWDQRKRGWHDHIAGTYAVRKKQVGV